FDAGLRLAACAQQPSQICEIQVEQDAARIEQDGRHGRAATFVGPGHSSKVAPQDGHADSLAATFAPQLEHAKSSSSSESSSGSAASLWKPSTRSTSVMRS